MLLSSGFYRYYLFCLLILRFVLCVKNETEPQPHWNYATTTPRIHQEEKAKIMSSDVFKKELNDCLGINGDMTSGDANLIQYNKTELFLQKNSSVRNDGDIFNFTVSIEWMKTCLAIMNKENYTQISQMNDEQYSNSLSYSYGEENDFNVDVDKLKYQIEAFKIALNIYKLFESTRDSIISKIDKSVNISDCGSQLAQQCLSSDNFLLLGEEQALLKDILNKVESSYILRHRIEPIVSVSLFCIGMIFNGTLLLIFYKHKEIRILPNIVVLNIAINDLLCLLIVLPLQYITYNHHNDEDVYYLKYIALLVTQVFFSFVSVFSILTLCIQRYLAISKPINISKSQSQNLKYSRVALIILPIWGTAGVIVALLTYLGIHTIGESLLPFIITFVSFIVLGGFIMPIIVSFLNFRIANRLYKSARDIPGEGSQTSLVNSRQRSSYILTGLTVSFWITHTPFFVWMIVFPVFGLKIPKYIPSVIFHLFFSNAILNPLSLYITSSVFRELFKKYLLQCWCKTVCNIITQIKLPPNELYAL